jgi:hypothetical protein
MATSEERKAKKRVASAKYRARRRIERELAATPFYCGPHRVIELRDDRGTLWVEAVPATQEAYWRKAWAHREILDTPLAEWLKSLPIAPSEHVLFARLDASTAKLLAASLMKDAALREPAARRYGRRTVIVRPGGQVDVFPSIAAALESVGIWRLDGRRHIGRILPDGSMIL